MKSISYKNSSYAVQKIVPVHARPQCTIGRFDGTLGSSLDSHAETTRHSYPAIDEPASLYEGAKALRSARHPASSRAGRGPLHSQEPPLGIIGAIHTLGQKRLSTSPAKRSAKRTVRDSARPKRIASDSHARSLDYLIPSLRMSLSSAFRNPVGLVKHAK
jgi:hypothetical protein